MRPVTLHPGIGEESVGARLNPPLASRFVFSGVRAAVALWSVAAVIVAGALTASNRTMGSTATALGWWRMAFPPGLQQRRFTYHGRPAPQHPQDSGPAHPPGLARHRRARCTKAVAGSGTASSQRGEAVQWERRLGERSDRQPDQQQRVVVAGCPIGVEHAAAPAAMD